MEANLLEACLSFSFLPNRNAACFRVCIATIWIFLLFPSFSPPLSCKALAKETNTIHKDMTLADCVFLAVRHSRSIESAYLDRVVQKFDLKVAEDEFIPNLTITPAIKYQSTGDGENRTYTNSGDISAAVTEKLPTGAQFSFTWANATVRTDDGDVASNTYGSSWQLSLQQPLLKGGGIDVNTVSLKTARINEQLNMLSLKSTIADIITSAIGAYRSFIQAEEQLEITRRSVARTKELLEVNRALIKAGRMAQMEIVQTEAELASSEFSLAEGENALDAARLNLLKILDIDKHTMVVPVTKMEIKPIHPDLSQCQALALKNRRDYQQSLLNLKISEWNLKVAENNRLWDLSLAGSYGIAGTDTVNYGPAYNKSLNADRSSYDVGVQLSIPFGDLTREQGVLSAKTALKKAKINLKELQDNIEIEVMDAVRDVEMKLRQVELAKQARELSEKKLEIEKVKLNAGLSSNFQLVSFQNDLVAAQNNELSANINYLNALTALDKTLETTLETWKIAIKEE